MRFSMNIIKLSFTTVLLTAALLTSSIVNCASAKDISIYRWVDKNNVIHFSQNLPKNDDYKEFSTISSYKALSKVERKIIAKQDAADEKFEDLEKQRDKVIVKNKAMYDKNCKAAQLNIKMLNSLDEIHVNEEKNDGTIGSRPLTSNEKEDKLALSKKHEDLYCSK
ncbi:MAG: hypothetical protein ACI9HU_000891 [Colwellia sp.]